MTGDDKVKDIALAGIKLESMGLGLDSLSEDQVTYRDSYSEGAESTTEGNPTPRGGFPIWTA